jgi:predicted NAD-dependent protein-ADP-ribosyltransferase YbiA (DUF1768 family)
MKKALEARFEVDHEFRRILGAVEGKTLLHYESRGEMYWGGKEKDGKIVGKNALGNMMMELHPKRAKTALS